MICSSHVVADDAINLIFHLSKESIAKQHLGHSGMLDLEPGHEGLSFIIVQVTVSHIMVGGLGLSA